MAQIICPRCQQRIITESNTEDFQHICNSGNKTLDNEDVVVIGDWEDYTSKNVVRPVAHYKMNDNATNTTVVDSSRDNTGTSIRNTNTMSTSGKINTALEFNGASDYIDCGNDNSLNFGTGNFSVSAWIKTNVSVTPSYFSIVDKWHVSENWEYFLFLDNPDDVAAFYVSDNVSFPEVFGTTNVVDNKWHHIVGVYDGKIISLYIDGKLDLSEEAMGNIFLNNNSVYIGANSDYQSDDSVYPRLD